MPIWRLASALTLLLGACGGGFSLPSFVLAQPAPEAEPGVAPEMPATIRADEIVGKWGLASFQNPADRARTEKEALAQCKQPYVIGAGTSGGVVMHLADQATPQELRLKGSPGGKNYIGPAGPRRRRAGPRDRLLRRTRPDHPFRRQGRRHPLRQHGLCPLRAAGVTAPCSRHCEARSDRSNPDFSAGQLDCFASLAMTANKKRRLAPAFCCLWVAIA